jgi:orotidine-5'-phosphate decarboxylase
LKEDEMTCKTIVAWDKSEFNETFDEHLLASIAPYVWGVKVGLESWSAETDDPRAGNCNVAMGISRIALELGLKVFLDLKPHDIRNTVAASLRNYLKMIPGVSMVTVHAAMSNEALRSIVHICGEKDVIPLAVTVLTDIDDAQCIELYGVPRSTMVPRLAMRAKKSGISGLVCSAQELSFLPRDLHRETTKVTPGTRPIWTPADDQKNIATPTQAALAGADYIVVGRPIMHPPRDVGSPMEAAMRIRLELDQALWTEHR